MKITDVHCHLTDPRVDSLEAISRAISLGVERFGCGGYDSADFSRQEILKEKFGERIRTSIGYHPWAITAEKFDEELKWINAKIPDADWIGETGLDYSDRFDESQRALQKASFEKHIFWANRTRKPLVLHIVRAQDDVIQMLGNDLLKTDQVRGFVHSFSGSFEQAKWFFENGFLLSFCGAAFRADRTKSHEVFRRIPKKFILLETDAPDQGLKTGVPSKSEDLFEIAAQAIQYRDDFETAEELLNQVTRNAEENLWKP